MERVVHTVWSGREPLSPLERLTLALWARQGFTPYLWTYRYPREIDGFLPMDAAKVLPESSIFMAGMGHNPTSFAHWSDLFQLRVLKEYGGWYSQLDVSCLALPDPEPETYFFPWDGDRGCQTCVMKCGGSMLDCLLRALEARGPLHHWDDNLRLVSECVRRMGMQRFVARTDTVVDVGGTYDLLSLVDVPEGTHFVHWGASYSGELKWHPEPGTLYHRLLEREGLLP